MTFSRAPKVPVNFTAYDQTTLEGEKVLVISVGGGYVHLPAEDAIAFAAYIQDKFQVEASETSE